MFLKRCQPRNLISKNPLTYDANTNDKHGQSGAKIINSGEDTYAGKRNDKELNDQIVDTEDESSCSSFLYKKHNQEKRKFGILSNSTKQLNAPLSRQNPVAEVVTYESSRRINMRSDQGATALYNVDTEVDRDNRSILERNAKIGEEILKGTLEEGIYRGAGAYKPIINRREGAIAAGKYTGLYGPVRGNQHVRMTLRIDYQPDICKDYKETGYCGWGNTCKFLHDRSDYKEGWKIDKEWNEMQEKKQKMLLKKINKKIDDCKGRKAKKMEHNCCSHQHEQHSDNSNCESGEDNSDDIDSDEDDGDNTLPFACLICRNKWNSTSNPVVTECRHYFCEKCAFDFYAKSSKCAECSKPTNGIFNSATDIINKIHKHLESCNVDDTP